MLYNTFMCLNKECDCLVLLRTYLCSTIDNIGVLKCKVLEHYSSICDAREVTVTEISVQLFILPLFFLVRLIDCCVCVCVFVCCLFILLCSSADMANKRVH